MVAGCLAVRQAGHPVGHRFMAISGTGIGEAQIRAVSFRVVALTLSEYAGLRSTEYRSEEELRLLARSRLVEQGPCSPFRDEILPILDWLDSCGSALDLFLGGFLEVRETWSGEIEFRFELWLARWRLDPFEVETRGHELRDLFNAGVETVSKAKRKLESKRAPPHASPWGAR
ncbi:MAG TPA: hypothetical protein VFG41_04795 [Sphingomicrobium sp.]|nr:hypothetical protein [Sphingomicrobium sp.]